MRGTGNRPPFSYLEDVGVCVGRNVEPYRLPHCGWCGRRVPDAWTPSERSQRSAERCSKASSR